MNPKFIARQYRELAIKAATPVGLVVVLYDMAIESMAHATREIDAGNIEARTNDLNHVLTVISELERSLNFEKGGEVAKRLATFYNVARCKILEANIKANKETVEQLSSVFISIRDAWQVVEKETAGQPGMTESPQAPRVTRPAAEPARQEETTPQLQWSA